MNECVLACENCDCPNHVFQQKVQLRMDNLSAVPTPPDSGVGRAISNGRNLLSRHAGRGHSSLLCFQISLYNKPKVPELRSVRRGGSGARAARSAAPRRPTRAGTLTLVADEEAHAGPAAVRGEEQRQERAGADQEVRRLRAVELADERRRRGRPVAHLQRVVVHLGLKPAHR